MTDFQAPIMSRDSFQAETGLPDNVVDGLQHYIEILTKWQTRMNLVGPSTMADPWRRHILESARIIELLPEDASTLLDMGSGAGFPGMVLSFIFAKIGGPRVTLVDSNSRKAAFLSEVNRQISANAEILCERLERVDRKADVVTARACAPLNDLLMYAAPIINEEGICIFHKGENYEEELTKSEKNWIIKQKIVKSFSETPGSILVLHGISRRLP